MMNVFYSPCKPKDSHEGLYLPTHFFMTLIKFFCSHYFNKVLLNFVSYFSFINSKIR